LTAADWQALRALRLHALRSAPGNFFSAYEAEATKTDEEWIALAAGDAAHQLFGLFLGERLVGMSGVFTDREDSTGLSAVLGMTYIQPEFRGRGLVARLYQARLAWARAHPQFLRAHVGHRRSNEPSRRAILRAGFTWTETRQRSWPDGAEEAYEAYELKLREP